MCVLYYLAFVQLSTNELYVYDIYVQFSPSNEYLTQEAFHELLYFFHRSIIERCMFSLFKDYSEFFIHIILKHKFSVTNINLIQQLVLKCNQIFNHYF